MIPRLFAAWTEGLAGAWLAAEALLRRPRRFRLRANAGTFTLQPVSASAHEPPVAINGNRLDKLPDKLLEQTRGSVIEIVVPAAAILERRLDVLPAQSSPYVDKVVQHQVEALFPWRADDILHSTIIDKRADGALDVSVRATARSAITAALGVAEACGAGTIVVVEDGKDGDEAATGILAATGSQEQHRQANARLIARYAALALLAFAACFVGWTAYAYWSLSSDVAALDQEMDGRRAIIQRLAEASSTGHSRGLDAKKKLAPVAVVVLDELSGILPNTTYLTDLSLDAGHLRISGISANAAELVPLLEGSGYFKNATFYAPTTRMAGRAADHFSIEATVVPQTRGNR